VLVFAGEGSGGLSSRGVVFCGGCCSRPAAVGPRRFFSLFFGVGAFVPVCPWIFGDLLSTPPGGLPEFEAAFLVGVGWVRAL